ncbi:hypothetical protein KIV10_05355 [Aequorivita echinoideorum]|uniref:Uncharacterized protein n=1 Tax=Aequorivita echinoideorum TaxID=1549647 RepID=A0ABS5S5G2_9FLAO|nr:hypothetical protein [Aequorivita echinoideorum]
MKKLFLSFAALSLVASIYSCRETTEVKVDETSENVADDMEDAMDDAADAVENAAEETGDAIENAADEVQEEVNDADNK